jgi:hypothetical protein
MLTKKAKKKRPFVVDEFLTSGGDVAAMGLKGNLLQTRSVSNKTKDQQDKLDTTKNVVILVRFKQQLITCN